MTAVANSFIVLDEKGRAWIHGANTKVIEVAMDELAFGWDAAEMHRQHPHLSLAQLHAALSYYHEHKEAFDAEMKRGIEDTEQLRRKQGETPFEKRLRSQSILK
jgi:uncharacterized protein (DUF433 family)